MIITSRAKVEAKIIKLSESNRTNYDDFYFQRHLHLLEKQTNEMLCVLHFFPKNNNDVAYLSPFDVIFS